MLPENFIQQLEEEFRHPKKPKVKVKVSGRSVFKLQRIIRSKKRKKSH